MRKSLRLTAVIGGVALSGCSATSSATHASLASIPASIGPTGASITEEAFTGSGTKTEPAVDLKGSKAWVYIACATKSKNVSSDPKNSGVRVSVGSQELGSSSCSSESNKDSSLTTLAIPLKGTITGPVKVEATSDTRWRVTLASGS